jgi:hypothetical protein
MWFLSGLLVSLGIVGLLTGLPLAVVGLILAARNVAKSLRGLWLFIVGLGLGAALLTFDDVLKFENDQCIGEAGRGFECPASGAHEIFWAGVILIAVGLITGAVARSLPSKPTNQPSDPSPLHSRNG